MKRDMKISNLAFVGIRGSVLALDINTGEQVWVARLRGANFVNVVLQGDLVLASCDGEIFCLEPFTGQVRWHNPLKGYGLGLATIATTESPGNGPGPLLDEKRRRDAQSSAAASTAV
jgi:hypothetical protein